jgi:addiction module RelE/StbE family toxin
LDKYHVKITTRATQDLDSIYSYISETMMEPSLAYKMALELENGILSLEKMSARCSERKVGAYANKGYRQLFIRNFTVLFKIDDEKKEVTILTVRYSKSQF